VAEAAGPETGRADLGGVGIAYVDVPPATGTEPQPIPVLLVHGFASNRGVNWIATSWTGTLSRAGYRVVAFDNRGHGESTKLYRPEDYDTSLMAGDAIGLLDHLGIGSAYVMGYSMGARITAFTALEYPDRVEAALLGGLGAHLVEGVGLPLGIADAMEAPSVASLTDPMQVMFRAFAEQTKSDLKALAACIRGSRQTLSRDEVSRISVPALVSVGTRDPIAGSPHDLADLLPRGRALDIPGRDHNLAVGDRVHKEGVLAFLAGLR
jgi:pimeloyl-ACP methyl ester carboxylesterase